MHGPSFHPSQRSISPSSFGLSRRSRGLGPSSRHSRVSCQAFSWRSLFLGASSSSSSPKAASAEAEETSSASKEKWAREEAAREQYNATMKAAMSNPYEYQPEIGLYYTEITPGMLVGTQIKSPEDVDRLVDFEGMTSVINMQQDKDVEYWGVDLKPVIQRCKERGVQYIRVPAVDFSGDSLRGVSAKAAAALEYCMRGDFETSDGQDGSDAGPPPPGTCYCHCTAGLGRSPGAVIAWMYWFGDFSRLDDAYDFLTFKRPCGPKKEAIRAATWDLLGRPMENGEPWRPSHDNNDDNNSQEDPTPPPNAGVELTEEEKQVIRDAIFKKYPVSSIMAGQPPRAWNVFFDWLRGR